MLAAPREDGRQVSPKGTKSKSNEKSRFREVIFNFRGGFNPFLILNPDKLVCAYSGPGDDVFEL